MKFPKIIILFIAVLSFMTSSAQVVQNTFSSLNFKGKIKKLFKFSPIGIQEPTGADFLS